MATPSFSALKQFFENAAVARKATRPLHKEVEVGLVLEGGEHARFTMEAGHSQVLEGAAKDPDFTLHLPAQAVSHITALTTEDVGELGVEFFKLALDKDPAKQVHIKINAPTGRLLGHGYLGVLAQGGMKVTWWLLKNGVKNPKAAIDRLRGHN